MRKRLYAIWSVLLVLVISIAVLGPGCGEVEQGTINVVATVCGVPHPGAVGYTLTGPGSPIQGTSVPASHSVDSGTWTCDNVTPPAGTFLVDTTPNPTQVVSEGGNITFTLEFEEEQDAGIECLEWTIDGVPYYDDVVYAEPCNWLDVHFQQWVDGCDGYQVALNETSWLKVTQTAGAPATIVVFNDDCAVNKTPEPIQKVSQNTTLEGEIVNPGGAPILLSPGIPVKLDVETSWELVKGLNYTKSINWLGIWMFEPMPHPCVLFELVLPAPGQQYTFILEASAEVKLVDDVDVNPDNDQTACLQLTVHLLV